MAKRRKHKPGCKCVSCSPATRARGMAALKAYMRSIRGRGKPRRHPNMKLRVAKKVYVHSTSGKKNTQRRALRRVDKAARLAAHRNGMYLKYFPVNAAWAFIFGNQIQTAQVINMEGYPRFFRSRAEAVSAASARGLDVDKRGNVTARNPKHKRRRHVVPAHSRRGGRVSGYKRKGARVKRHMSNPPRRYIGSNATIYSRPGVTSWPHSNIYCGPGPYQFTIVGRASRGFFSHQLRLGSQVTRVDYDNRAKALRAYGKPGRFKHDFGPGVEVVAIRSDMKKIFLILRGSKPLWKGE